MNKLKPHFNPNQSEPDYRQAAPELSQTVLKNILAQSPAHAREAMLNPPDTAAMRLGRAAHCLVLEGDEVFNQRYAVAPECDRRTREGKAIYAEFEAGLNDREVITAAELETLRGIDQAIKSHAFAGDLFQNGQPEVSAYGYINGAAVKGRFDYYHPDEQIIIDFKTCLDASPESARKHVVNYGLHIQQYVYSELHRSVTGSKPADFVFVMIEKSAPYGVAVFRLKPEAMELARAEVERGLEIYQQCQQTGAWPGYPEAVQEIDLPPWHYMKLEAAE